MPESSEVIQLFYDGEGRLRVEGNINADALLIQDKGTINSASTTNANLGGKNNTLKKSTNSAIIGGENNMVNDSYSSIILGGKQSNILKGKNVIFAMADNTTIPSSPTLKKNIFVWGGDGNQIAGGKVAIFSHGGKTRVANDALLIGANIDANGLKNLFVWSDRPNFAPKKSSALYINAKNGLGLNTTKPVVQLDAGNAGGLKMRKANILTHGTAANKGLIVAVEQNGKKGYCGFDGKKWVALDVNPETQNLCSTLGQTSCNGDPQYTLRGSASPATQVWNPQGNLGNGTWEVMPWIYYQKDPGNLGTCEYVCRIGYHPNVNNPSGWFRKSCQLCTEIANRYTAGAHQGWRTSGTGVNNCDFGCKAGFKYRNDTVRACPSCEIGKWTPDNNQEKTCKNCTNKPESLTYRVAEHKYINGAPILSPLQNGTLTNFSNYTTTGTSATSCKWTCDASLGLIPSGSFSAGSLGAGGLTIGGTP